MRSFPRVEMGIKLCVDLKLPLLVQMKALVRSKWSMY